MKVSQVFSEPMEESPNIILLSAKAPMKPVNIENEQKLIENTKRKKLTKQLLTMM